MGKLAAVRDTRKALVFIKEAIDLDFQGVEVEFQPKGSSMTFNTEYNGWDLYISVFPDLCLTFYVDKIGNLLGIEVWVGDISISLKPEEREAVEDVYFWLDQNNRIPLALGVVE